MAGGPDPLMAGYPHEALRDPDYHIAGLHGQSPSIGGQDRPGVMLAIGHLSQSVDRLDHMLDQLHDRLGPLLIEKAQIEPKDTVGIDPGSDVRAGIDAMSRRLNAMADAVNTMVDRIDL